MSTTAEAPLTVEGLFSSIIALTRATEANTAILERVVAGQQAAMEKLEGAKAPATRGGRGKKADEAVPAAEKVEAPAAAETKEAETTKSFLPDIAVGDGDALKAHIQPWLGAVAKGTPEAAERVGFLKAIAENFGVEAKFGPLAAEEDRLKQTLFYFERKKAGLEVDFKADYDFAGDPAQDGGTDDDSEFG